MHPQMSDNAESGVSSGSGPQTGRKEKGGETQGSGEKAGVMSVPCLIGAAMEKF